MLGSALGTTVDVDQDYFQKKKKKFDTSKSRVINRIVIIVKKINTSLFWRKLQTHFNCSGAYYTSILFFGHIWCKYIFYASLPLVKTMLISILHRSWFSNNRVCPKQNSYVIRIRVNHLFVLKNKTKNGLKMIVVFVKIVKLRIH